MARFTGFDEVFSALYVDFDNIYTRFLEADPEAARTFGSAPYRWVRWIENHALRILYGEGVRRRILKRMCYLNPQRYQEFRNPFIRHELISITLNTTSKWRARVLPSLKAYMQTFGTPPVCLCFGFAANIVFARCGKFDVKDDPDVLAFFAEHGGDAPAELCRRFCARTDFWGEDLNLLPGFADTVTENLNAIARLGARAALQAVLEKAEKK